MWKLCCFVWVFNYEVFNIYCYVFYLYSDLFALIIYNRKAYTLKLFKVNPKKTGGGGA